MTELKLSTNEPQGGYGARVVSFIAWSKRPRLQEPGTFGTIQPMRRPSIREKVPPYLHPYIAEQDPSLYTPIDHAGWRYIMRVSKAFFAKHAHQKYLDGLTETGIGT